MASDRPAGPTRPAESIPCIRARGVIFDGDDTLWLTEALYDDARASARAVVEHAGLNGTEWERLQRIRDLYN
ncbi:MAG: hypothetical protein ABI310_05655, partial [Microbacteriaceae bacterium]